MNKSGMAISANGTAGIPADSWHHPPDIGIKALPDDFNCQL
jgi:hypothetical protein